MTWTVAIDESGDTGRDSRFFTMAAVIAMRSRNLLPASKAIPKCNGEFKFYKAPPSQILEVLNVISNCPIEITYVTVDKYDYTSNFYGKTGNTLYSEVLTELLKDVLQKLSGHDVNIFVDDNTFISKTELNAIAEHIANCHGCNVKKCTKVISEQNKCIQLADLVVGAIYRFYENEETAYIKVIGRKVSVARKS